MQRYRGDIIQLKLEMVIFLGMMSKPYPTDYYDIATSVIKFCHSERLLS